MFQFLHEGGHFEFRDDQMVSAKYVELIIVSASSAYHIGESFLTGGRHALEEAMCFVRLHAQTSPPG